MKQRSEKSESEHALTAARGHSAATSPRSCESSIGERELELLHRAVMTISRLAEEAAIVDAALTIAAEAFAARDFAVFLRDDKDGLLRLSGTPGTAPLGAPPNDPACIVEQGRPLRVSDFSTAELPGSWCFAPLQAGSTLFGLLGLESANPVPSGRQLELFCAIGTVVAVALEQVRSRDRALSEARVRARLTPYFSPALFAYVVSHDLATLRAGVRMNATVVFADIRNFTRYAEHRAPEEVLGFLNRYFEHMIACVHRNGGVVDKLLGDGLLAVFGIPRPDPEHARGAVRCATEMQHAIEFLRHEGSGPEALRVGIGIHSGPVVMGDVGAADLLSFTVLGSTVNVASRVEALTKRLPADALLSAETYALVRDAVFCEAMPPVWVSGIDDPVRTYALRGLR